MESPPSFLDVGLVLERSVPRPRSNWVFYALGLFALVALSTTFAASAQPQIQGLVRLAGGVVLVAVVLVTVGLSSSMVRQQRSEQLQVDSIEELVQLRRWDQAAAMLEQLLEQPARSQSSRVQALIYLASVLSRYHRYGDAIVVQDYLLDHVDFDPATARALRLMRAMSMLHEERLFDADRAISDLRREAPDSAGLALVEMYRDVKTGHPAEAVDHFSAHGSAMRTHLGTRVADAWALAARAHDLLGQEDLAQQAFERATLLTPVVELARKYSEFSAIKDKYRAARPPWENPAAAPVSEDPAARVEQVGMDAAPPVQDVAPPSEGGTPA